MATQAKQLIRTEDDVYKYLDTFENEKVTQSEMDTAHYKLKERLELARVAVLSGGDQGYPTTEWSSFLRFVGRMAYALTQRHDLLFLPEALAETLLMKHQAYGAEPILRWKMVGFVHRMDSKTARYTNLLKGADTGDEDVGDTLTDLIGYAVLGLAYLDTLTDPA